MRTGAILLAALGIFLVTVSSWPVGTVRQLLQLNEVSLYGGQKVDLSASVLELEQPAFLRVGGTDKMQMRLKGLPAGVLPVDGLLAAARLDLPCSQVVAETLREPLLPGQDILFQWDLASPDAKLCEGRLWFYLESPIKGSQNYDSLPVLAAPVRVRVVSMAGMPAWAIRYAGVALALIGLGLWLASFYDWKRPKVAPGPSEKKE